MVNAHAHLVQGLRLGQGAGHPVQDEAVGAIGLLGALCHDAQHQPVRHQSAAVHAGFHLLAQVGTILHGLPEHVSGGDGRDVQTLQKHFCLGSLTRTGGA